MIHIVFYRGFLSHHGEPLFLGGKMVQQLRALGALPETWFGFTTHMCQLTAISNTNSRKYNATSSFNRHGARVVHRHT